ncbi:MAG: glycosyltransferase family 4 protein [Terracidiphilus sp.]|jgi:glycosyltransferase involved in cell wall biosynthesis
MRILVAHNRYQFSGGEDAVVRDEIELLQRHGHSVELLEQDNDAIHGIRSKLIASTSVFYSARSRHRMKQEMHDFQPDLVHIHNWFPMLSPSIVLEAGSSGVPVVQTLHNFRMLCANALLYRDGVICTDCVGKSFPTGGVVHGCYRGNRAGSAIVTAAYAFHRLAHTWDRIDLFIAVSEFEREILIGGGLPAGKVVVKPNFVNSYPWNAERNTEDTALFVGRLSPEKGIRTLLSAWTSGRIPLRLKIIGDGPMAEEVSACATTNIGVEYLGEHSSETVYREMTKAKFLVFPSECFETFGRTVVEAFSRGTPVLAADLGSVRELVEDGVTGYRFTPKDANALVAGALRFPDGEVYKQMSTNCRSLYLSKFTAEINYTLLMKIYAKAIAVKKERQQIS